MVLQLGCQRGNLLGAATTDRRQLSARQAVARGMNQKKKAGDGIGSEPALGALENPRIDICQTTRGCCRPALLILGCSEALPVDAQIVSLVIPSGRSADVIL